MKFIPRRALRWSAWAGLLVCWPVLLAADTPSAAPQRPAELEAAWWNLSVGDFKGSEKIFRKLAAEHPSPRVKAEAWFALGESAANRPGNNIAEARQAYRNAAAAEPDGPFAPWALLAEARVVELDFNNTDLDVPLNLYQQILRNYASNRDVADEVTLRIAGNRMKRMDRANVLAGIDILESWLKGNAQAPLAATALTMIANVQVYPLADYPAALNALQRRMAYPVPQDISGAGLYFLIANIAHHKLEQPNLELAAQYYRKLLREMPWDARITDCRRALKEITGQEEVE